ncbi:MAG TPA: hypothetical protein PKA58_35895 [Polyangium sp.]|nr:hypothetical protein [Polyangium sp.]
MSRKYARFLFGIWALTCVLLAGFTPMGCLDDLTMTLGRCADDGNPCTNSDCTSGVTKHEPLSDHTACALGMNAGVCIAGDCVLDCADAGTPCPCVTVEDCPNSADCKVFSCNGGRCTNPGQIACQGELCTTDLNCANGICRDGVCCDSPCNETCWSCAVPGNLGRCDFVPIYSDDDGYTDAGASCAEANGLTCDGQGQCLKLVGAQCTANEECMSQICVQFQFPGAPYCQPAAAGAPCTDLEQCQSKSCVGGKCGPVP